METELNEITINGVNYVPKGSASKEELNCDDYVIVRTQSAGVFAGYLRGRVGQEVNLSNA